MRALIQRVRDASVAVDGHCVGAIEEGLLVLLGVAEGDDEAASHKLADKVARYRVFADDRGRMNLSLVDTGGGILVVPQFTLAADTRRGLRPSFTPAAAPATAEALYGHFVARLQEQLSRVETGRFGADMQVSLCNDGPVTFLLESGNL